MVAKIKSLFTPASLVLLGIGGAILGVPMSGATYWTAFGVVLLAGAALAYSRLNAGQACSMLGGLMFEGAYASARITTAVTEFRILAIASFVLVACGLATLLLKRGSMAAKGTGSVGRGVAPRPLKPTTGEVMAERQRARKQLLPAPRFITPSFEKGFSSIAGMDEFKKKLRRAGFESAGGEDRNGILLHGEPGNGKTVLAKALAGELGLEFIPISKEVSKWVGEESQALFNQINEAIARAPCVLFIDEADSILGARGDSSASAHLNETNAIVNRLLTYLVDYRRSGVVFVAATNFIDMIDPAIRRAGRFDYVLEVPNPDLPARVGLLELGVAKHAPGVAIASGVLQSLAKRWDGFNTATVLAVPAQIPQYLKDTRKQDLQFDDFMAMLRIQQGMANRVPESTKSFKDMSYPQAQGSAIKNLISRMHQSFEIEEVGGAAPSGVLFFGDPGTGKTETARMIAKETKWAFFPLSGSDLARDPGLIDKALKKVRNARPAIIFIDEADDLLGDRANSGYKAATNKLLEAMDGPLGRMNDLLWIASTNFVEASDAAVIRSGRFTEKVRFNLPEESHLLAYAKSFFAEPKRNAVVEATWNEVMDVLDGCSIADAHGILLQAWNLTLTANGGVDRTNPVTFQTLAKARDMVRMT